MGPLMHKIHRVGNLPPHGILNLFLIPQSFSFFGWIPLCILGFCSLWPGKLNTARLVVNQPEGSYWITQYLLWGVCHPFIMPFLPWLSYFKILVFNILYSLKSRPFEKRVCKNMLRSFHMDWVIWIFIFNRMPDHMRGNLVEPIRL